MNDKRIVIDVEIKDIENLFNPYNDAILNSELNNYLLNQFRGKSLKDEVVINISSKHRFTEEEQKRIKQVFKDNFKIIDYEDDLHHKINRIRSILLFIIGVLFIYVSYFLNINNNYIFSELILIIGWVAIWELCDYALFSDTKNKVKSKRIDQLSKAKIVFLEDK